jgi:AAA ATPase containing von Willebrand factor type A (vWA) domain
VPFPVKQQTERHGIYMGMLIGTHHSNTRSITIKNAGGSIAGTITVSKPKSKPKTKSSAKQKKKSVQYSFTELSNQILQSKTFLNAKQIASRAYAKAAVLRRKRVTGDYDETAIDHAITHAERMARVAKKRAKHLKEEARCEKEEEFDLTDSKDPEKTLDLKELEELMDMGEEEIDEEMMREMMKELTEELQAQMEELEKELAEDNELDEMSEELSQIYRKDMSPEDLELLKKKHRSEEIRDIMDANRKYLRAMFEQLAREKQELSNGVSLQLGGTEMPVQMEAPIMTEGGTIDVMA